MARPSHDDVCKEFTQQLLEAEQAWRPHLLKFKHNYDLYLNNKKMSEKEKKKDLLYVHHIYQQIETIVPRMVTPDPKFDLEPREGQDEQQVRAMQRKVDYDIEIDRFVEKQVELSKTALICGLCVGKVIWDRKKSRVKRHNFNDAAIASGEEDATYSQEIVERDGPSLIPINMFDWFPQPGPTSIEAMEYCFHRTWLTQTELEARADLKDEDGKPLFKNIKKAIDSKPSDGSNEMHLPNESSDDAKGRRGNRYEVIERWKRGRLTVVVNRKTVIRDCANPYWHGRLPFVAASSQPDIRSLVGISEVEVIENIARMIHKFENLRIRAAEFAVNPVLKMKRSLKGGDRVDWRPGGRIYLDRLDDITTETANPNLQAGWAEVQAYLGYMQQVSGVSPFIAGADPSVSGINQETATGASILQAEANKRLALKLLQMQTMYSKVAKMFVQLNQQFMTENQLVRIAGADGYQWVEISPQEIAGAYDVRSSNSTESLAKSAEIQRLTDALNILTQFQGVPMSDGTVVDLKYPLKQLLTTIGVDPEKCFSIEPPPDDPEAIVDPSQLA